MPLASSSSPCFMSSSGWAQFWAPRDGGLVTGSQTLILLGRDPGMGMGSSLKTNRSALELRNATEQTRLWLPFICCDWNRSIYLWRWASAWLDCVLAQGKRWISSSFRPSLLYVTKAPRRSLSHCCKCLPPCLSPLPDCMWGRNHISFLSISIWHRDGTQQMFAEWMNDRMGDQTHALPDRACPSQTWLPSLLFTTPSVLHNAPAPTGTSQTPRQLPFIFAKIFLIERMQFW